jgi:hypothetical protein
MKILKLLICFFLLTFPFSRDFGQSWDWGRQGYVHGNKPTVTCAVATDAAGNAFLTGGYQSSIAFGNDTIEDSTFTVGQYLYFVKFNSSGSVQWLKQFGTEDVPNPVVTDISNNVIIAGVIHPTLTIGSYSFSRLDYFIAKFNNNGNVKWVVAPYGYSNETGLAVDRSKNIFITGDYYDSLSYGSFKLMDVYGTHSCIFIAKYDSNGNALWARQGMPANPIGSDYNFSGAITTDLNGNSFIGGVYNNHYVFGNDTLISKDINNNGGGNVYIVKYDPNGNLLWARQSGIMPSNNCYAFNEDDHNLGMTTDDAGSVYITGEFNDSISFGKDTLTGSGLFFVKYDANGNEIWAQKAFTNGYGTSGSSLVSDANNNIYLGGYVRSDSIAFRTFSLSSPLYQRYSNNSFIVKFDTSGNALCGSLLGNGSRDVSPVYEATDNTGKYIYLASIFSNDTIFCNTDTLLAYGQTPYVARWVPCGVCALANASISAPSSICKGDTAAITAIPYGSTTTKYLWSPGGQTSQTILVSPTSNTKYVVTITDTIGGCWLKDSVNIRVKPLPQPTLFVQSIDTICNTGGKLFLFGGPSGGSYGGAGVYGNYFYPDSVTPGRYSVFYYSYTDTNGCTGVAMDSVYVVNCLGINEVKGESKKVNVYPNPFTNNTTITVNSTSEYYIELTDVTGRKLKSFEFAGNEYTLSAEGLASGMYFIRVSDKDKNAVGTTKIVIQ